MHNEKIYVNSSIQPQNNLVWSIPRLLATGGNNIDASVLSSNPGDVYGYHSSNACLHGSKPGEMCARGSKPGY